ncbi:MAG TPA: RNA-guided endonuclease TnpB family protein [Streptosporangiaceae bacterium]
MQAFRFALDPSPAQERALQSYAGAARFAWNWGLAKCQEAFRNLDRALHDYVKSRKGERKGRRLGFPKFKKRGRSRDSFRLYGAAIRCGRATVTLPRLGTIRTHEQVLKLSRKIEDGAARILSATVSRTAQRWFVSFAVEVERYGPERHARPGAAIGVDLGIKTLLTGVDDQGRVFEVAGPRPLRAGLRRLRRASRAHSRRRLGSAGRRKGAARLARIHARVASVRADALHKATTALAARYERVVVEDLNVTGMLANRRLARAMSDQGFGAARRMLGYKTAREGGTLVVADRWYPSSKKCSGCGSVKAKLTLAERIYQCDACGLVTGRDVNAARNLLSLAASGADRVNACGAAVRPGLAAGRAALKQEPGTANADQTGTAAIEAAAA